MCFSPKTILTAAAIIINVNRIISKFNKTWYSLSSLPFRIFACDGWDLYKIRLIFFQIWTSLSCLLNSIMFFFYDESFTFTSSFNDEGILFFFTRLIFDICFNALHRFRKFSFFFSSFRFRQCRRKSSSESALHRQVRFNNEIKITPILDQDENFTFYQVTLFFNFHHKIHTSYMLRIEQ